MLRTHTSNVQIRAMTGRTPPFRLIVTGPRLPPRPRRHATTRCSTRSRASCVDERVTLRRPEGRAARVRAPPVRRRRRSCASARTTSRSPSRRPRSTTLHAVRQRAAAWLGEWGGCGMIHPDVLRALRHRPRALPGLRVRDGHRPHRDAPLRHPAPPPPLRGRRCACWRSELMKLPLSLARRVRRPAGPTRERSTRSSSASRSAVSRSRT